ncbi:hypothetical protein ILYODFUR_038327 [Ilyodon furcidens]|uniref:Uncharacterized protein n=1 Tax=Ilyodon furcidens TaxID=33524 RepID=A0ABV0T7E4_9TELE
MVLQPEAAQWLSWSLEQVALILGQRFPNTNIWVVRASRMYLHKFSCYQNFVESNMFGAPEHSPYSADCGAFRQLRSGFLLQNFSNLLQKSDSKESGKIWKLNLFQV